MSDKIPDDLTDFEPEAVPEPQTGSEPQDSGSESTAHILRVLQEEKEELHDRWLRSEAEIQNLRRRFAREKQESSESARASVLKEILPVIDSCEQGLQALDQAASTEVQAYHEGLELLLKGLKGVLARFDVVEVPGIGERFDPTIHEAVLVEEREGHADGEILDLLRKGYAMRKRLLRPAQVKVASAPSEASLKED